jgi:tRNA-specific 2-thiouridylase
MTNRQATTRVAVGLSGGVDSTMAACLLLRQGYAVTGITMQTWDGPPAADGLKHAGCYGPGEAQSLQAAKAMADRLGIEHRVVPLAAEFRTAVLDYFRREYLAGRTPNPCIACNRQVKFGFLLDKARSLGVEFDYFATGHYARVEAAPGQSRFLLRRGLDQKKDQSYFLSQLSQEQLRRIMFPLGALPKSEVKDLARELGFRDAAEHKESQDFFEGADYTELFGGTEIRPGPILDRAGNPLGQHKGIVHYTIGQRKGVGLSGAGQPLYVVAIDAPRNALIVGIHEDLFRDRLTVTGINWIALDPPGAPLRAQVQLRQQHQAADAVITPLAERDAQVAEIKFDEPQMAIAPGQAAVFYQADLVLGGGTILQTD